MAIDVAGVLVSAAGWATLVIELCDPSSVQSDPGVRDVEGVEIVWQEERGETPPHLGGCIGSGGTEMKRHEDLGYVGFLQLLRQDLPSHNHRRALERWG